MVGDEVNVFIDKERRLKQMKLHSAIHISYYFIVQKFGQLKIIGSNVAEDKARVDFSTEKNLSEMQDVEDKLNSFLSEGHDIHRFPDQKLPDMRWWNCGEWKMPCGGTHVKNTGEIGPVKLRRITKGAGKERIELYLV
jgi:alanyl-tRNA synthetase